MAPQDHLPLSSVELLLLTMLAAGDRHGYGLRQDILQFTSGNIEIEAGNLYRHIRSLEDHDFIATARTPRNETDERRIYYKLTSLGKRVLAAEMTRLRSLVHFAEERGIIAPLPA